jgi:predicted nucleic acid-binding Zn ribbon protein
MADYTYKCTYKDCSQYNVEINITKKMSEPAPDCTECSNKMEQVFKSAAHFTLKGSGWTGSNIAGRG